MGRCGFHSPQNCEQPVGPVLLPGLSKPRSGPPPPQATTGPALLVWPPPVAPPPQEVGGMSQRRRLSAAWNVFVKVFVDHDNADNRRIEKE